MATTFVGQRLTTHKTKERVIIPPDERERRAAQYVFLIDIAAHLGRTATAILTKARRLGIVPIMLRRESSGKGALAVTKAEALRVIESDVPTAETIMPADLFKR